MSHSHESHRLSWLEKSVLLHVTVLLLFSSWAFGGNIWWARLTLSIWGSLALPLCIAAFVQGHGRGRHARRKLGWLIPPALYAGLVFASTYNPSFATTLIDGSPLLAHKGAAHPQWPSTVSAAQSIDSLWFGAGLYLSAFNLAVVIRSRRALHFLLILISANALVLAVVGTVQKLADAGFYFGGATSPNPKFFATFIYYNHWGAFMVLCLATTAGLLFNQARHHRGRDLWQSPFSAALVGFLFIAISGPLSASRAATVMSALLVAVATGHALVRLSTALRHAHRPVWPAATTLLAVVALTITAVGWLGFRGISERYHQTQVALGQNQSLWGERLDVYADTAVLAQRQPLFGWGLNSYDIAFQLIRERPIAANRQYESSYATAHNDWLQSLAETGIVGTALLLLTLGVPLAGLTRRKLGHPLVAYPLLGLAIVLLYALIEFPFSCGAFLITFWVLFFTALRKAELTIESPPHAT
jgi:O-antigen ligase